MRTLLRGPQFDDAYMVDAGTALVAAHVAQSEGRWLGRARNNALADAMVAKLHEHHRQVLAHQPVRSGAEIGRLPLPTDWDHARLLDPFLVVARAMPFEVFRTKPENRRAALEALGHTWGLAHGMGSRVYDVVEAAVAGHDRGHRNGRPSPGVVAAAAAVATTDGAVLPHEIGAAAGLKDTAALRLGLIKLGGDRRTRGRAMVNGRWLTDQAPESVGRQVIREAMAAGRERAAFDASDVLVAELVALQSRTAVIDWMLSGDLDAVHRVVEGLARARAEHVDGIWGDAAQDADQAFDDAITYVIRIPAAWPPA